MAVAAVVVPAAACSSTSSTAASSAAPRVKQSGAAVTTVEDSALGAEVLAVSGRVVYVHLTSGGLAAPCTGACLTIWPAVDATAVPSVSPAASSAKLSTTAQAGGVRVLTVDGLPVYYFSKDTGTSALGEGITTFGGTWYVLSPAGVPIKESTSSTSPASTGSTSSASTGSSSSSTGSYY
jgi:predicted lipoprotein with Yx(FWY)xxD motif